MCAYTPPPPSHTCKTACSELGQVQSVRPGLCFRLIPDRKPLLFDGAETSQLPRLKNPGLESQPLSPFLPLPLLSISLPPSLSFSVSLLPPLSIPPPSLCLFSNI